jgi:hypothetical protein
VNADKLLVLKEQLRDLEKAAAHLRFSIERTAGSFDEVASWVRALPF